MAEIKLKEVNGNDGLPHAAVDTTQVSALSRFRRKLQDPEYKGKLTHSLWIALSLATLGAIESQSGPTFLDLQLITKTDVERASAFFTSHSCGYLTGSVISGLVSKKVNRSLFLFVTMVCVGACAIVTPYCSLYGLMIFIKFVAGIFGGIADSTGNAEHMRIWGNDGRVLMQFIHFCFALGGVLSPLLTEPFLAKRPTISETNTSMVSDCRTYESNCTGSNATGDNNINPSLDTAAFLNISHVFNATNVTAYVTKDSIGTAMPITNVHYAFLITGIISCMSSVPFLALFIKTRSKQTTDRPCESRQADSRKLPRGLHLFLVFCLCAFYASYTCVEDTFAAFLMTFVVREYAFVTKSQGAFITAVYWGCFAASRFFMIFISQILSSVRLLFLCGSLMVIAFICFTVSSAYAAVTPLTIFAGMAGLSMSAIFPAGFSWSESELVKISARVSSSIFVSASVGAMLNPLLLAFLMEEFANMWFCYLFLAEVGLVCSLFIFLLLFNRYFVNKRYGPLYSTELHTPLDKEESNCVQPFMNNEKVREVQIMI